MHWYDYEQTNLIECEVGNTVTGLSYDNDEELGTFEFTNCVSITLPNSIKTIGVGAFRHTQNLKALKLPNNVNRIDNYAFENCGGIGTEFVIPASVTKIGEGIFSPLDRVPIVICEPLIPPALISSYGHVGILGLGSVQLKVPMESVDLYKTAQGWSEYSEMIIGY